MRAIRIDKIGIGKITELAIPQPEPGQLLVRDAAVGVCLSDVELWGGSRAPAYIQYPVTPGHEWSGTVTEIGSGGAGFAVHDRVAVEGHNFCNTYFYCKCGKTNLCSHYSELGFTLPGAYAEYVTVRADLAHTFSAALPFEVNALTEPASCVANGILRATLGKDDTLVVVGPGTIGLLAVAWARHLGVAQVLAVGLDSANQELAYKMGTTHYANGTTAANTLVASLNDGRGADHPPPAALRTPDSVPLVAHKEQASGNNNS